MQDLKINSPINRTSTKTVMHPLHKGTSTNHWEQTKQMAFDLNKAGIDVAFLPEYVDKSSADAITMFKKKYIIADFKYSASSNWNTLSKELINGFNQSNTIVLKLDKMDLGGFRESVEYLKRNDYKVGNIKLINRKGNNIDLSYKDLKSGLYEIKIRGFL